MYIPFIVFIGLLFQLLTSGVLPELFTVDFSIAQICALPVVLYLLMKLRVGKRRVPTVLVFLALLGAIGGLSYGYTYAVYQANDILLTRFRDDPLEAKTRRFRKLLNQRLRQERTGPVGRYYSSIENHRQVEQEMVGHPDIHTVVWGNSGWLQLSLNENAFMREQPLASPIWSDFLAEYQLINYVPATGLSVEPQPATIRFLSDIFSAFELSATTAVPLNVLQREKRASFLKSAGGRESTWTSYAHRSFPLFLLGNQHIREAFRNGQQDMGELACAIWTYSVAEKYLKRGDNPELTAALFNNKAIALLAVKAMKPKSKADQKARTYLRAAMRSIGVPSPFGSVSRAWVVASQNWQIAVAENRGGGKKRMRKKQRKAARRQAAASGDLPSKKSKRQSTKKSGQKDAQKKRKGLRRLKKGNPDKKKLKVSKTDRVSLLPEQ